MLINKTMKGVDPLPQTRVQLLSAAVVVTPYFLLTENLSGITLTPQKVLLLLTVGIVHTGLAYVLFLGQIPFLPASSASSCP